MPDRNSKPSMTMIKTALTPWLLLLLDANTGCWTRPKWSKDIWIASREELNLGYLMACCTLDVLGRLAKIDRVKLVCRLSRKIKPLWLCLGTRNNMTLNWQDTRYSQFRMPGVHKRIFIIAEIFGNICDPSWILFSSHKLRQQCWKLLDPIHSWPVISTCTSK